MLNEHERSDLKQNAINAWETFCRFQYETIEPHFYKQKKGQRMEPLNPWKSMKERIATEQKSWELYQAFHELRVQYWQETSLRVPLATFYKRQETPNGDRWVKL